MKNIQGVLEIVAYQKDEQGDYTLVIRQPNGYYVTLENMHSFGLKNLLENSGVLKLESWVDVRTWMRMKDNLHEEELKAMQPAGGMPVLGDLDALTELKKKMTEEPKEKYIIDHAAALNPSMMKVLGYYVEDTVGTDKGYDGSEEPTGSLTYHIVLEGGYEFTIRTDHGMCGSGYCSATWGCLRANIVKVPGSLSMMTFTAKYPFYITTSNERSMVYFRERDSEEYYDAMTTEVMLTNNEVLCHETGNGGCGYYPSGYAYINEELFDKI